MAEELNFQEKKDFVDLKTPSINTKGIALY